MRALRTTIAVAACTLLAAPVTAHEFWIEPASFTVQVGEPVAVELRVGDELPGQAVPRDEVRTLRFESVGADGSSVPIRGREGGTPAGLVRFREAGARTIAFESTHTRIEIDAERFEAYLEDKGLEHVAAERRQRGERARPGRERFARCAKALIAVDSEQGNDRALGMTLELVAETDPYQPAADGSVSLRLLFRGRPLPKVLVKAWHRGPGGTAISARTDNEGRVSMPLPGPGMWLVSAVHMLRSDRWPEAEWESYWASLTFDRTGSEG